MRRSMLLVCLTSVSLATTTAFAQLGAGGIGAGGQVPAPAEDLQPIELEIAILDVLGPASQVHLTDEQQLQRLERLESERKLVAVQRFKLCLIPQQPAQLQVGETALVPVGSNRGGFPARGGNPGGPGGAVALERQNVGTMIQAMAKPMTRGVLVDLKIERTGVTASRPEAADAPAESPKPRQLNISTAVQMFEADAKIVGGIQTAKGDGNQEETWVVARAKIGPPVEAKPALTTVYTLKVVQASEAAELLRSLFEVPNARFIPEIRTNTLLVQAPDEIMKQVEPLLRMLDERAAEMPKTKTVPVEKPAK